MTHKTSQVGIRVTSEQRQRWEQAAEIERRNLTDWVRLAADDEADRVLAKSEEKKKK